MVISYLCILIHLFIKNKQSGELVALKKIHLKKIEDGIPNNILR